MITLNTVKVDLGGSIVWVSKISINGHTYVSVATTLAQYEGFRIANNFLEKAPEIITISKAQFKKSIPSDPILKSVTHWEKMGIPIKINRDSS
jgi:hypothetical protein